MGDVHEGLRLPTAVREAMVAHCRREYPKEACGLLVGTATGSVEASQPMHNVENSPIGYAMDPKEQLMVEKQLRQKGQRVIGIYHSHTASDAYPSSVDVSLAISPDVSYVLVSLKDPAQPDVKSFRIDGTTITPEPVTLVS
jgi:proteasome lid subunit RPN8/RPN11